MYNFKVSNLVVFVDAEEKFGKRGNKILTADGSQVEDLNALRENDHLYIFWELFKYMGKISSWEWVDLSCKK